MKNTFYCTVLLVTSLLFTAFLSDKTSYEQEIRQWHEKRIESLKQESGWLNLAGLFWLNEGVNTFGSEEKNEIKKISSRLPLRQERSVTVITETANRTESYLQVPA